MTKSPLKSKILDELNEKLNPIGFFLEGDVYVREVNEVIHYIAPIFLAEAGTLYVMPEVAVLSKKLFGWINRDNLKPSYMTAQIRMDLDILRARLNFEVGSGSKSTWSFNTLVNPSAVISRLVKEISELGITFLNSIRSDEDVIRWISVRRIGMAQATWFSIIPLEMSDYLVNAYFGYIDPMFTSVEDYVRQARQGQQPTEFSEGHIYSLEEFLATLEDNS
ncbi:MAG: hypothetical protein HONBIEJF_02864 [Fimbriimonadaceae bacterium]|nr:hypothetical protein [Fimbriimonadaceae bacterium]